MNERLTVQIGADVKGLEQALKKADALMKQHERNHKNVQTAISSNAQKAQQLEKSITQLSDGYKRGTVSQINYTKQTDRLSKELREVNQETSAYQRELKRLEGEMQRVSRSSSNFEQSTNRSNRAVDQLGNATRGNAVPAMISFSQVVQDAPYGIQGVANNIQQLTMQFGYLSKSSGGAGGALKAMAGSLMGPTGILLGVSLVSTALITFGDELFNTKTAAEKLKEAQDKLNTSLDTYVEKMEAAARASLQGLNDATGQLTRLKLLKEQLDDTSRSEQDRIDALNELKKLYPSIFSDISQEQALNKSLGQSYDTLRDKLLNKSEAEAATKNLIENNKELNTITSKLGANFDELRKKVAFREDVRTGKAEGNYALIKKEVIELAEEIGNLEKRQADLLAQNKSLTAKITSSGGIVPLEFQVNTTQTTTTKTDPVEVPFVFPDPKQTAEEAMETIRFVEESLAERGIKSPQLMQALDNAELYSEMNKAEEALLAESEAVWNEYLSQFEKTAQEQDKTAQYMARSIQGMVQNMVNSLIDGKFEFEDFGKSVMKSLLGVILNVATGGIGGAIGSIFGFSGGGIVGATGLASGVPGFASGGIVGGSSYTGDKLWARLNSGEMVLNNDQQKTVGNWGEQIERLQSFALNPPAINTNFSPSPTSFAQAETGPLEIVGETRISGEDLMVVLQRSQRRRDRIT